MIIHARAPHCILEIGRWTDTPVAEYGAVFCCAIECNARVTIATRARPGVAVRRNDALPHATLWADGVLRRLAREFDLDSLEATVETAFPVDGGTAAMAVALTAAMTRAAGRTVDALRVAYLAHRVTGEALAAPGDLHGCMAAAFGGVALHRFEPYPRAFMTPLHEATGVPDELERRLLLVRTGRIADQRRDAVPRPCGKDDRRARAALWHLRRLPLQAFAAVRGRDFAALAQVMREHAVVQQQLCPALNPPELRGIAAIAESSAGTACLLDGASGTIAVLCEPEPRAALLGALRQAGYDAMPVPLAHAGVLTWTERAVSPPASRRRAVGEALTG